MLIGQLKSRLSLNKANKAALTDQPKETAKIEPELERKEEDPSASATWFVDSIVSHAKE